MKNTKRVLLVFPGLDVRIDEGARHRLNSFIDSYAKAGYRVSVLAFVKGAAWPFGVVEKRKLDKRADWILFPYILPISRNRFLTWLLVLYVKVILGAVSRMRRYDIIQSEILGIFFGLSRRKGTVMVTDFHGDLYSEVVAMKNMDRRNWFVKWMLDAQALSIKDSDHCICVSENLKDQLEANTGMKMGVYTVISCGVDFVRFSEAPVADMGIDLKDRIVLGYCGGLQKWQNIESIISLFRMLQEMDRRVFLMIYTNSPTDGIRDLLDGLGKENFAVLPLKFSQVPSHLKLLDAGFLLREDLVLNKVSSPTKICEYLAAGVPLVCTRYSGDYARSVGHGREGFVLNGLEPSQSEAENLMAFLHKVKADREFYAGICRESASGRTFYSEFERLKILKQ